MIAVQDIFCAVRKRGSGGEIHCWLGPPQDIPEPKQGQPGRYTPRPQRIGNGGVEPAAQGAAAHAVVVEEVAGVVGGVDAVLEAGLGGAGERREQVPRERRVLGAGPALPAGRRCENDGDRWHTGRRVLKALGPTACLHGDEEISIVDHKRNAELNWQLMEVMKMSPQRVTVASGIAFQSEIQHSGQISMKKAFRKALHPNRRSDSLCRGCIVHDGRYAFKALRSPRLTILTNAAKRFRIKLYLIILIF